MSNEIPIEQKRRMDEITIEPHTRHEIVIRTRNLDFYVSLTNDSWFNITHKDGQCIFGHINKYEAAIHSKSDISEITINKRQSVNMKFEELT